MNTVTAQRHSPHSVYKLTSPAPNREWIQGENGLWSSRQWTKEGMEECLSGGGFFNGTQDIGDKKAITSPGIRRPVAVKPHIWTVFDLMVEMEQE